MIKDKKKEIKQGNKAQRSRSRSKSPQNSKGKLNPKGKNKNTGQSSIKDKLKNKGSVTKLVKSQSKNKLNKSQSDKKLNRSSSARIASSPTNKNVSKKGSLLPKDIKTPQKQKIKTKQDKTHSLQQPALNSVKNQQKQMGLIFMKPQFDKINFKSLETIDQVFDKYLEMVNNDNDASYVMNALPELRSFKKEDEMEGRDFVSGRVSRLSGIFQNLSVDKIITPMKKVPNYYSGQCGKNLTHLKIMLQTKFKVQVDVGFLQYSLDGDKLTIFRIYLSKIYRRMNYVGFVYLETFKALMQRHPGADRWCIFVLQRNVNVHKFFKYLGFHIEKVAMESKNKTVDYFQEFNIKKKELNTILSSMTK